MKKKKKLGTMLLEAGLLTEEQRRDALVAQKGSNLRLGQFLVRKGILSETQVIGAISEQVKVEKYHPIIVLKKSGNWYRFHDFEKDEGWIHQSIVSNISSVITKKKKCNVRSGPGTTYDILFTVENGVPFKVIERKGRWIHIHHADGDKGWIHESLVW